MVGRATGNRQGPIRKAVRKNMRDAVIGENPFTVIS